MGRRRRVAPDGPDQRSQYLDSLLADPASVRTERQARAREFWTGRAQMAAREAAQAESLLPLLRGGDLTGAKAKAGSMRRALYEAAARAGLAPDALLTVAAAAVAEQDGGPPEANGARARGSVARGDEEGQQKAERGGGAADDPVVRQGDDLAGVDAAEVGGMHQQAADAAAAHGMHQRAIEKAAAARQKSRVLPGTFAGGCQHCRKSVVSKAISVFEEVNN